MTPHTDPATSDPPPTEVLIVGGGLAGLACATRLCQAGKQVRLLEATDRVGGRLRTERVDGFLLDAGFQVLLTAYPACRQLLDYDALRLQPFEPGALIRLEDRFGLLSDPWRRPQKAFKTAFSPVGTVADKLRIARLRAAVKRGSLDTLFARPQQTTEAYLRSYGFSNGIIEQFFRPFLGGIFLERELATSSRAFEFVFRMFAAGEAAVPAAGMEAIATQLAERMPTGTIELEATVESLGPGSVTTSDGRKHAAQHLVIATEASAAARLLHAPELDVSWQATHCFYFTTDTAPIDDPILVLDGTGRGPVNHLAVLSNVAPSYAPAGRVLVSANVVGPAEDPLALTDQVTSQLSQWFGDAAKRWELLRVVSVPFALPQQGVDRLQTVEKSVEWSTSKGRLLLCGDHRETSSIQGALQSGLRAAEQLLEA